MCGFAGFLTTDVGSLGSPEALVTRMASALQHRGPDDAGAWADVQAGIALGHRRLSIIDLSHAGYQPMHSAGERFVLAFNGEIYNHLDLRGELEADNLAPTWRGHSDTETLLAGIAAWGLEATLRRCVGMFAIALWDREEHTLTLARDRFGEKPLYYGWVGGAFLFGSELKALKAYPGFAAPVSREALAQYLRFMYVPAPLSIYEGIYKLGPGCLLTMAGLSSGVKVKPWWDLADVVQAGLSDPLRDEAEALQLLEKSLAAAVRLQSLADVPLGAFLSGGVDSSAIVALMQQQATRPVKTFTVGFAEAGFDESPHARAVAQHLGTEHHALFVTAPEAQAVITALPQMYDEPFADSSQIPTHLVCRAARQQVTVALSGDAGDELFGGYNRYFWGPMVWNKVAWLPMPVRQAMGKLVTAIPTGSWDAMGKHFRAASGPDGVTRLGDKLHKLGGCMQTARSVDDLYRSLVSEWQDPANLVRGADGGLVREPHSRLDNPLPAHGVDEATLRMMFQDTRTYLPDDILCKLGRAAMACGLKTRVPFLDNRLVELAWRLPQHMKIRGNVGKWALRQVLYKHVPRELIERPKAGFAVPIGQWLRGPLRAWAEELLAEHRLQAEGYLHPGPVRQAWFEHVKGQRDHTPKLWAVLMFHAWLQEQAKPQTFAR